MADADPLSAPLFDFGDDHYAPAVPIPQRSYPTRIMVLRLAGSARGMRRLARVASKPPFLAKVKGYSSGAASSEAMWGPS